MYSFIVTLMILPIIVVAFKAGYAKANKDAEPKIADNQSSPIYDLMALKHPETFMFMKSEQTLMDEMIKRFPILGQVNNDSK